jgi:hypothetical protein
LVAALECYLIPEAGRTCKDRSMRNWTWARARIHANARARTHNFFFLMNLACSLSKFKEQCPYSITDHIDGTREFIIIFTRTPNGSCSEPAESNPNLHTQLLQYQFQYYISIYK